MSNGILTNEGISLLATKQSQNEPLIIDRFLFAYFDGLNVEQEPPATEPMPPAPNQVDELPVTAQGYIDDDSVVYSCYMGTDIGDYDFNWVGMLSEEGTLVAVSYVSPILKYATAGQVLGNAITRNFTIVYNDAKAITNINVEASTWQFQHDTATETYKGIVQLATPAEVAEGANSEKVLTPKTAHDHYAPQINSALNSIQTLFNVQAQKLDAEHISSKEFLLNMFFGGGPYVSRLSNSDVIGLRFAEPEWATEEIVLSTYEVAVHGHPPNTSGSISYQLVSGVHPAAQYYGKVARLHRMGFHVYGMDNWEDMELRVGGITGLRIGNDLKILIDTLQMVAPGQFNIVTIDTGLTLQNGAYIFELLVHSDTAIYMLNGQIVYSHEFPTLFNELIKSEDASTSHGRDSHLIQFDVHPNQSWSTDKLNNVVFGFLFEEFLAI